MKTHGNTDKQKIEAMQRVENIWFSADKGFNSRGKKTLSQTCREAFVEPQTYKNYCAEFNVDEVGQ